MSYDANLQQVLHEPVDHGFKQVRSILAMDSYGTNLGDEHPDATIKQLFWYQNQGTVVLFHHVKNTYVIMQSPSLIWDWALHLYYIYIYIPNKLGTQLTTIRSRTIIKPAFLVGKIHYCPLNPIPHALLCRTSMRRPYSPRIHSKALDRREVQIFFGGHPPQPLLYHAKSMCFVAGDSKYIFIYHTISLYWIHINI